VKNVALHAVFLVFVVCMWFAKHFCYDCSHACCASY